MLNMYTDTNGAFDSVKKSYLWISVVKSRTECPLRGAVEYASVFTLVKEFRYMELTYHEAQMLLSLPSNANPAYAEDGGKMAQLQNPKLFSNSSYVLIFTPSKCTCASPCSSRGCITMGLRS